MCACNTISRRCSRAQQSRAKEQTSRHRSFCEAKNCNDKDAEIEKTGTREYKRKAAKLGCLFASADSLESMGVGVGVSVGERERVCFYVCALARNKEREREREKERTGNTYLERSNICNEPSCTVLTDQGRVFLHLLLLQTLSLSLSHQVPLTLSPSASLSSLCKILRAENAQTDTDKRTPASVSASRAERTPELFLSQCSTFYAFIPTMGEMSWEAHPNPNKSWDREEKTISIVEIKNRGKLGISSI